MPKWNLKDDWPENLKPEHKKTGLRLLFSMPIPQLKIPDHKYSLELKVEKSSKKCIKKGMKKLIIDIDIQTGQKIDVLAMTPGLISSSGNCITLTTDIFTTEGVGRMLCKPTSYPVSWFRKWIHGNTIPEKIIYDNVVIGAKSPGKVQAGDTIGQAGNHPNDPAKRRLILAIEYKGSTKYSAGTVSVAKNSDLVDGTNTNWSANLVGLTFRVQGDRSEYTISKVISLNQLKLDRAYLGKKDTGINYRIVEPRGMHPREFFSLLFWKNEHDPIFKKKPTAYGHALLRLMMGTGEQGQKGPAASFIKAPKDTWLCLRPPLRTFQRVKWEHIKEHLRASSQTVWEWGSSESVKNRIMNDYLAANHRGGYVGDMKCNIYCGEILFRSGFRTIVWAGGLKCAWPKIPNKLKYLGPTRIDELFSTNEYGIAPEKKREICKTGAACSTSKATHAIRTSFGKKLGCNKTDLNNAIQLNGDVFFLTNTAHVPIIHEVKSCSSAAIKVAILDQDHTPNNKAFSRDNYFRKSYDAGGTILVTIIKALPGGDPTEEWGKVESNCLKKVK